MRNIVLLLLLACVVVVAVTAAAPRSRFELLASEGDDWKRWEAWHDRETGKEYVCRVFHGSMTGYSAGSQQQGWCEFTGRVWK
jgi:hypothetical protein